MGLPRSPDPMRCSEIRTIPDAIEPALPPNSPVIRRGTPALFRDQGSRFAPSLDKTDAQRFERVIGDRRQAGLAVAQRPDRAAVGKPALVNDIEAVGDLRC